VGRRERRPSVAVLAGSPAHLLCFLLQVLDFFGVSTAGSVTVDATPALRNLLASLGIDSAYCSFPACWRLSHSHTLPCLPALRMMHAPTRSSCVPYLSTMLSFSLWSVSRSCVVAQVTLCVCCVVGTGCGACAPVVTRHSLWHR
jgi:hypothetical protein